MDFRTSIIHAGQQLATTGGAPIQPWLYVVVGVLVVLGVGLLLMRRRGGKDELSDELSDDIDDTSRSTPPGTVGGSDG